LTLFEQKKADKCRPFINMPFESGLEDCFSTLP
jgi:hypothetical protein